MSTLPNPGDALTREEQAFFIKSFWEASMAPDWTNDPLIELGKAVGAKIPLQHLTTRQLDMLWPFLLQVAQKLGDLVLEQADRPKDVPLSREDTAFFMRSYYEAISAPSWKRSDIIAFGTAVRDKVPLAKLGDGELKTFMPYLQVIAQKLGGLVIKQAEASRPAPAQPTAPPAPKPVATPQPVPPAVPKPAATPQPVPPAAPRPAATPQPAPPAEAKPTAAPQPPTSTIAPSPPEPVPGPAGPLGPSGAK
jgi:hypothetical protein